MPASRANRLAELRALRAAGKTGFSTYEVAEEEQLYDTVDDEGYKKLVRSRLDEDDFVVDDNGAGYADDGREDWQDERRNAYDSESEEELPTKGKAGMRALYMLQSVVCMLTTAQRSGNAKRTSRSVKKSTTASANTSVPILQCRPLSLR